MTSSTTGGVAGYSAGRTLPIGVELKRQLTRRRTHVAFGLTVALPVLLVIAFAVGGAGGKSGANLIDLATRSGVNFTVFTLFVSASFLIVVVAALFFGDTIASEASWSSLKYLLAIPVPRSRLLRQKAIVAGMLTVGALVVLPTSAFIVGTVVYGSGELVTPFGDALPIGTAVLRLIVSIGYLCLQLAWVAALALLLSVLTDAPLGAVGGTVMVSIISGILDQITSLGAIRNYLPGHYYAAWYGTLNPEIDWSSMTYGVFSALVYGSVFGILAWQRFSVKDITS